MQTLFTKKGILRNHDIMLWFALWALTPAGSNPAESQALGHQPWMTDPPCEEVGSDKLAGTVWYNFTLEGLHRDMQVSLSKRSWPKKLVSGTVSEDWRKWIGKVRGNMLKSLTATFLFSISLIQNCSKYEHCQKDMQSSGFGNHHSKLVNSPLAGSKQKVMDSSWERVDLD